jgi:putative ABC transport system permease protein
MGWINRVMNVLRPSRLSHDLERELAFHLQEATDRLIESGMPPDAAAREAARRFGHRPTMKERTRDMDIATWLESLLADVRYAFRSLRAAPGFTLVAVLSLALGIGANTAIFSLIDTLILKALPVAEPEQLVKLAMGDSRNDVFTNPLWEAIRDQDPPFNGVFAFGSDNFDLASSGQSRMVDGNLVSGGYFSTLAIQPALGRLLQPADDQRGCAGLAVVSYGFWQSEFGGATDLIGRQLSLNRQPFTIVGVVPRVFSGVEVGRAPQVYVPLCTEPLLHGGASMLDERSAWWLQLVGRIPEGTSLAQAQTRLVAASPAIFGATLPANWGEEGQRDYLKRTLSLVPAATGLSEIRRQYQTALLVLMGVVGVVLLIACANVANLLLVRAAARRRELAMRLAIGASRGRIIRQALTESILLSTVGAALGLVFARWSSRLLAGMIGGGPVSVSLELPLDLSLLGFSIALALITGILFGVAPAWRSVRLDVHEVLKSGGGSLTPTGRSLLSGKALVVGQVALSLVLVALAGLLVGSFRSLATSSPGFEKSGVVLARLNWGSLGLSKPAQQVATREILDRLHAEPGIAAAGGAVITPVSGRGWNSFVLVQGYQPSDQFDNLVWFNGVTDGYFTALGTPLLAGRDIAPTDQAGSPKVAVVNRAFARKFFGSKTPVGQQLEVRNDRPAQPPIEIVGVVGDAKYRSLRDTLSPTVYIPWTQTEHFDQLTFQVRGSRGTAATVASVLAAVQAAVPSATLEINTLAGQLDRSLARERLLATLSGFFGGLALLLALIGLYGTMAYSVTRRKKEIGIRVALGATRTRLVRMVTSEAGRMIAAGLVVGALGVVAATRLVRSFLYERSPLDPVTILAAVALVALVALSAGALPAIRAVRQDPQAVLREE